MLYKSALCRQLSFNFVLYTCNEIIMVTIILTMYNNYILKIFQNKSTLFVSSNFVANVSNGVFTFPLKISDP